MSGIKNLNRYLSAGIQGDTITSGFDPRTDRAGISGADVTVGNAVWYDADGKYVNTGTGKPVGIAMRALTNTFYDIRNEASMIIPANQNMAARRLGNIRIICKTSATGGQSIFANTTDGSFSAGNAGATIAGSVETKWRVIDLVNSTAGQAIPIEKLGE